MVLWSQGLPHLLMRNRRRRHVPGSNRALKKSLKANARQSVRRQQARGRELLPQMSKRLARAGKALDLVRFR